MSKHFLPVMLLTVAVLQGAAIPVSGTGLTAEGAVDPNWTIISPAGAAFVTVTDAFPITPGLWISNDANSKWIEPISGTTDDHATNSTWTYRTTFSLNGLLPSTAVLTFRAAGDNLITGARLNGNSLGFTHASFSLFSLDQVITNDAFFLTGTNTLEFDVFNGLGDPNPTGLRVQISGTADQIGDPPDSPEPATVTLIAAGLGVLLWKRRAR